MKHRKIYYQFNLIELLVVIAIIGLLAALAFPVLSTVKQRAKQTHCLNNLHQIGIQIVAYSNDYNGYLPVAECIGDTPDDKGGIQHIVPGKTKKLYLCIADNQNKYSSKTFYQKHGSSYEWNAWLNGEKIDFKKIGFLPKEALPLMWDADQFHGNLGVNFLYSDGKAISR